MKGKILFSVDGIEGYKENIEKILEKHFETLYYLEGDMIPKNQRSLKFKILREINNKIKIETVEKLYKSYLKQHQKTLIEKYEELDYFLVIAGREFSIEFIEELKRKNRKMKSILFLWDKYELTSLKKMTKMFDFVFTFDREDAERYGFIFRPSFYLDECLSNKVPYKTRKYEAYYIGTLREKKRYYYIEELAKKMKEMDVEFFLKLFVTKKEKENLPKKYKDELLLKTKIGYRENIEILKNSKVVLDLQFENQTGLTLRAIESLATETKVITTNKDIKNYDFYSENNIKIIESAEDIEKIDKLFFKNSFQPISPSILQNYSAEKFIEEIFEKINKRGIDA